jgi:hypothetical protein
VMKRSAPARFPRVATLPLPVLRMIPCKPVWREFRKTQPLGRKCSPKRVANGMRQTASRPLLLSRSTLRGRQPSSRSGFISSHSLSSAENPQAFAPFPSNLNVLRGHLAFQQYSPAVIDSRCARAPKCQVRTPPTNWSTIAVIYMKLIPAKTPAAT